MTQPAMPSLGVRLEGVRKSFGSQKALAGVDLDIPQGSYVAVMGANGAGKTTLLKVIAGLAAPTAGSVRLAGVEMRRAGPALRAMVGYVSHESMLYQDLTTRENLLFHAKLFSLRHPEDAVARVAARLAVEHVLDRPVRTLSRGTRQRATIARALLHDPLLLLLDEPYTGLDEAAAASLTQLLRDLHTPERTLIATVHEVSRAVAGAERLIVLDAGKVVLDRTLEGDTEEIFFTYLSLLRGTAEVRA